MVEHIVLLKWKPNTTADQVNLVMERLRELPNEIPGILDLQCGENFSDRSQGYTHGLVVRFVDRAALETYSPHPAHRAVVEETINPIREVSLGFDFEIT